jgi:DNA-binding XRE family transcriptional regulator
VLGVHGIVGAVKIFVAKCFALRYKVCMDTRQLSQELKARRMAKKLTQEQLGVLAGMTGGVVRNIETQRTLPSLRTLDKIATALGTTVQALLRRRAPSQEGRGGE